MLEGQQLIYQLVRQYFIISGISAVQPSMSLSLNLVGWVSWTQGQTKSIPSWTSASTKSDGNGASHGSPAQISKPEGR